MFRRTSVSHREPFRLPPFLIVLFLLPLLLIALFIFTVLVPASRHVPVSEALTQSVADTAFTSEKKSVDRVRLLTETADAMGHRLRMISDAQEEILLSASEWRADSAGTAVAAMLRNAAQRGVKVRILVDGASALLHMTGEPVFLALAAEPNVEIKTYQFPDPRHPTALAHHLHENYLVVDNRFYILGGRTLEEESLGKRSDDALNFDLLVWNTSKKVKKSSLSKLRAYFESVWALERCTEWHNDESALEKTQVVEAARKMDNLVVDLTIDYYSYFDELNYKKLTLPTNKITLLSNPVETVPAEPRLMYTMTELMKGAEESVLLMTPYVICDKEMYQSLSDIAAAVPSFDLMLNSVASASSPLYASDYLRSKSRVLKTGASVSEYVGTEHTLNGTAAVIDSSLSLLGSFHWSMRSAYLDTDLALCVDAPKLNKALRKSVASLNDSFKTCNDADTYTDSSSPAESDSKLLKFFYVFSIPIRSLI